MNNINKLKYRFLFGLTGISQLADVTTQGGVTVPTCPPDQICNPLKYGTIQEIINTIASFLFTISIPIVTIMVLYGAFMLLTSGGNEERIKTGRKVILWAIIGFVVMLIAGGMTELTKSILNSPA